MKNYKLVNTYPVAKFYYKGSHSHPIQRTVLITESNEIYIIGYEVRVGHIIRQPNAAPIKSYLRAKIAKAHLKKLFLSDGGGVIQSKGPKRSTLKRSRLYDYLFSGP